MWCRINSVTEWYWYYVVQSMQSLSCSSVLLTYLCTIVWGSLCTYWHSMLVSACISMECLLYCAEEAPRLSQRTFGAVHFKTEKVSHSIRPTVNARNYTVWFWRIPTGWLKAIVHSRWIHVVCRTMLNFVPAQCHLRTFCTFGEQVSQQVCVTCMAISQLPNTCLWEVVAVLNH